LPTRATPGFSYGQVSQGANKSFVQKTWVNSDHRLGFRYDCVGRVGGAEERLFRGEGGSFPSVVVSPVVQVRPSDVSEGSYRSLSNWRRLGSPTSRLPGCFAPNPKMCFASFKRQIIWSNWSIGRCLPRVGNRRRYLNYPEWSRRVRRRRTIQSAGDWDSAEVPSARMA